MWSSTSCLKFQSFFWSKYYLVSWYTSYWINFIIYLYTYNCSFWILHWVLIYISKLIQANKKRKASHNYTDLNPFLSNSYIYCTYTNLSSDLNSQCSLEIQLTSFCLSSNSTDNKESTTALLLQNSSQCCLYCIRLHICIQDCCWSLHLS